MRVLSLSEKNDDILMWSHYATEIEKGKGHNGVVFKLKLLPNAYNKEGTALCSIKPIRYEETPPTFYSVKDLIEDIFAVRKIDHEPLYLDYIYTKSTVWKYEQEWRVCDLLPEKEQELYKFYPITPEEISAIYFGINTNHDDQMDIIALAQKFNSEIKFYKAEKAVGGYKLNFSEM